MSPVTFRRKIIKGSKTLGEQLAAARLLEKLSLEEVERATQVRAKYLTALEEGRYDALPEDVYTLGFVRRYARFLGLSEKALTDQYRAERVASLKRTGISLRTNSASLMSVPRQVADASLVITPKWIWMSVSSLVILGVAGYLWYQVHGFMAAPNLELASLAPDMIVASPTISIEGRAEGNAFVTINAEPIPIDDQGTFRQEVHLENGVNTIEVAAKNRLNKETKKQIRVLAKYP